MPREVFRQPGSPQVRSDCWFWLYSCTQSSINPRSCPSQAATVENPAEYEFRVRTSCPPDTRLHVAAGTYWTYGAGSQWLSAATLDLADADTLAIAFTGTRTYRAYVLARTTEGFAFHTDGVEYATAAEAEDAAEAIPFSQAAWSQGIPLARVILREYNGGIDAIEPTNRGRSYVW